MLVFPYRPAYVAKQGEMASTERVNRMNWPNAVVFDLDGTLVDTAPDILAYLNEMLAEFGRPPLHAEAVRDMIGDGILSLMTRGLNASGGMPPDLDLDELFNRFLVRYTADPARLSRPFEGAIEVLDRLQAEGVKLGVCTNKPQCPTDSLLASLGLAPYFGAVLGGDAMPRKKPDPSHLLAVLGQLGVPAGGALLVGDSETDLKTARAANIPVILVSFGYTKIPACQLGADHVIDHFDELIPILSAETCPPA